MQKIIERFGPPHIHVNLYIGGGGCMVGPEMVGSTDPL